ncbi:MAG: 2Fe-2S iron-sulfur cluster-binding protein [Pseudobdellovibrionaceae bacterium]|jgi:2Fe-2S ferredoxin
MLFLLEDKEIFASNNQTVLEACLNANVQLDHSCGGYGTCGTCLIEVVQPKVLPQRNDIETEMAQDRKFLENERLACQLLCKDQLHFTKKALV